MITKRDFVSAMRRLDVYEKKAKKVQLAISDFCDGADVCFPSTPISIAIDILKAELDDRDGWLEFFCVECDFMRDFKLGDITYDGIPVELNDWGTVYNFLVALRDHTGSWECEGAELE